MGGKSTTWTVAYVNGSSNLILSDGRWNSFDQSIFFREERDEEIGENHSKLFGPKIRRFVRTGGFTRERCRVVADRVVEICRARKKKKNKTKRFHESLQR